MAVTVEQGDMFEWPNDVMVNAVNCVGIMGAGVAKLFADKWPAMLLAYQKACRQHKVKPGLLHIWQGVSAMGVVDPTIPIIINFPTMVKPGEYSKKETITAGLVALRTYLQSLTEPLTVAIPALGCGIGGLDFNWLVPEVKKYLDDLNHDIYLYQPFTKVPVTHTWESLQFNDVD